MFGLNFDVKSMLYQFAALILGIMLVFASVDSKILHDIINMLSSVDIPRDWKPFVGGFGGLLLFYVIIK